MLLDGEIVGNGDFGKFEKIESKPVTSRQKEYSEYVKTAKGDSDAATEMVHYAAFKSRVDKAWNYINGIRNYDEVGTGKNPINLSIIVVSGLAVVGAAILFIVKFYN